MELFFLNIYNFNKFCYRKSTLLNSTLNPTYFHAFRKGLKYANI